MEQTTASPEPSVTVQNGHRADGTPSVAEPWIAELRAWKLSIEHAERANRNLRQHAAGIAALLGIQAGSGGVFALAQAVTVAGEKSQFVPDEVMRVLIVAGAAGAALSLSLGALLVGAFRARRSAEAEADKHLARLIEAKPLHFLPKAQ